MLYQEFTPSPFLKPYIERIWTLETGSEDVYPLEHIITPNGAEGWILSFQTVAQKFILYDQPVPLPQTYILTQPYAPWTVVTEGCSGIVGVFFRAGSLHALVKTSMTQVIGQVIEPQAFFRKSGDPLLARATRRSSTTPPDCFGRSLLHSLFFQAFSDFYSTGCADDPAASGKDHY